MHISLQFSVSVADLIPSAPSIVGFITSIRFHCRFQFSCCFHHNYTSFAGTFQLLVGSASSRYVTFDWHCFSYPPPGLSSGSLALGYEVMGDLYFELVSLALRYGDMGDLFCVFIYFSHRRKFSFFHFISCFHCIFHFSCCFHCRFHFCYCFHHNFI